MDTTYDISHGFPRLIIELSRSLEGLNTVKSVD